MSFVKKIAKLLDFRVLRYLTPQLPLLATMTSMGNFLLGSQLIQAILPTIVKDNIEVASFFALLTYVLFLVNWLVSTDWLEKVSASAFK